ncbi:MAG: DUF695 domain-containing protein [Candidatus Obscuribacterales bacterium]|jgi:hypothetical protein
MRPPANIAGGGSRALLVSLAVSLVLSGCASQKTQVPAPQSTTTGQKESFEPWAVAEGQVDGKPIFIRQAVALDKRVAPAEYPYAASISVPYKADDTGMPQDQHIFQDLNNVEDLLAAQLENKQRSLFAGVVTNEGVRTFIFYTADPKAVTSTVRALQTGTETKLNLDITLDRDWKLYRETLQRPANSVDTPQAAHPPADRASTNTAGQQPTQ